MHNTRDSFGSKFGAIAALAGSAVGLGNILVSTGVTFVVCAICSLLCALWAMRKVPMKVAMCRIFR
jgi:DHA1 family bicyclomycin/chloramphenicol resistance-like MFS transporter